MGWPIFVVGKVVNCLPVAKKTAQKCQDIASKMLVFPGGETSFLQLGLPSGVTFAPVVSSLHGRCGKGILGGKS